MIAATGCVLTNTTDYTWCKTCAAGQYLDKGPGTCKACSTIDASCTTCTSPVCTACSGGKVPQYDGFSCVTTPTNCATLSATDKTVCGTCSTGYYWTGSACALCNLIDFNCLTCTSSGICTSCASGFVPSISGTSCLAGGIPNCATVNSGNSALCDTCNAGYWWNGTDCALCSTISGCTTCSSAGVCTACTAPQIPQVGGLSCVT